MKHKYYAIIRESHEMGFESGYVATIPDLGIVETGETLVQTVISVERLLRSYARKRIADGGHMPNASEAHTIVLGKHFQGGKVDSLVLIQCD